MQSCLWRRFSRQGASLRTLCKRRRLVERVSADEVTVDYANDLDTAQCGKNTLLRMPFRSAVSVSPPPHRHHGTELQLSLMTAQNSCVCSYLTGRRSRRSLYLTDTGRHSRTRAARGTCAGCMPRTAACCAGWGSAWRV